VKLANCLVFTSHANQRPVLKLTDFGLSMVLPEDDHKLQIFCGTPSWVADAVVAVGVGVVVFVLVAAAAAVGVVVGRRKRRMKRSSR
jgi:hypothetical protein